MRRKAPSADSCAFSAAMRRAALSVMTTARSLPTSDIASDMYCALHLARATARVYLSTLSTLSKRANAPNCKTQGVGHAAGIAWGARPGEGGGAGGQAWPAPGARTQGA